MQTASLKLYLSEDFQEAARAWQGLGEGCGAPKKGTPKNNNPKIEFPNF
jgi:hypothetical protein